MKPWVDAESARREAEHVECHQPQTKGVIITVVGLAARQVGLAARRGADRKGA